MSWWKEMSVSKRSLNLTLCVYPPNVVIWIQLSKSFEPTIANQRVLGQIWWLLVGHARVSVLWWRSPLTWRFCNYTLCSLMVTQNSLWWNVLSAPVTETKCIFYCSRHLLKQILADTVIVIGYLSPVTLLKSKLSNVEVRWEGRKQKNSEVRVVMMEQKWVSKPSNGALQVVHSTWGLGGNYLFFSSLLGPSLVDFEIGARFESWFQGVVNQDRMKEWFYGPVENKQNTFILFTMSLHVGMCTCAWRWMEVRSQHWA